MYTGSLKKMGACSSFKYIGKDNKIRIGQEKRDNFLELKFDTDSDLLEVLLSLYWYE